MQIKIVNEQPFQVLSSNFTIGPSSSGYDLMFSADGVEYSKLFTVGANTNRQVTQVAAGSYYFLSGNTDTVTVNWMKDCGGSGSGGGSYVLPVASENTLGGVKIGSGLTMSGDTLNANPGGYTLPMASDAVLGGVKIGSGITIDANGVISADVQSGGSSDNWIWYSMLEYQDMSLSDKNALFEEMAALYSAGTYTFGFLMDTEDGVPTQYPVWKYEDETQKLWFRAVYARCYDDDPDNEMGYAAVNASVMIIEYGEENVKNLDWGNDWGYATEDFAGVVKVGTGISIEDGAISVNIGDGLAFSGNTIVVSGGTGGGGIEKVSTLPLTAEEGDVVWLEGHTQSGYTITMDMSEKSFESGYQMAEINYSTYECESFVNYGVWQYSAEYGAKMRSRRNGSTRYLDIITDNSVSLGQDADSMQTGVEFPFLGKFYAYEGGMWHNIAREVYVDFDKEPNKVKEYFIEIYSGLTDFDGSDLVIFYRQDSDVRTYAAFKPYFSAHYGIDCQSNDSRGARDSSWGQIRVDMNRLSYDWEQDSISFNTLVGTKWSATVDQLSDTMCVYVDPSGDMGHRDVNCLFDEASQHNLAVKGCELDFSVEYGFGSIVYARRITVSDVTTYYWSLIVPTDTDVKKGVWHATDLGDMSSYTLDSWTTV